MEEDKYSVKIEEMKTLERSIKRDLAEFQKKVDTQDNTIKLENQIKKNIGYYQNAQAVLNKDYQDKFIKYISNLPQKEYSRRVTEIRNLLIAYDKMNGDYSAYQTAKYKYKPKNDFYNQDYEETKEMKGMTNTELFNAQQGKIKVQNKQIDEIIGEAKIGKELAVGIKVDLNDQNKLLDEVGNDMDKLESRMERTRKKFESYVAKSSHCCLIIIAILEGVAMFCILQYLK